MTDTSTATGLTDTQRHIVEWGDGPAVVIAGAGSGKTRVIVERVRWLLQARGGATEGPDGGLVPAKARSDGTDAEPFAGPLLPEQLLVLTYNVKAAKELGQRLEERVGAAARARLNVSNFHSFCHRVLTESASDAGLPAQPDVLDGIGQLLLLRDIRRDLPLLYYSGRGNPNYWLDQFVAFINRAKDELVTPDDFAAFADRERLAFEERFGSYERALERVKAQGNLDPLRPIRSAYAAFRREERAEEAGDDDAGAGLEAVEKVADREARRAVAGDGSARRRNQFDEADLPRIDELAETYVADGAALEVLRVSELAIVYRAYQEELAQRGALDFGEQISLVTRLLKQKPNVLRRYQRSFRYLLVDEFQDANIAQIELIELLGARLTGRTTSWSWATTTSPSTASGAPASRPSRSSTGASAARPRMIPARRLLARPRACGSRRTSARWSPCSRWPTGSSRATSCATRPTRSCAPRAARASRSSSWSRPTSRTRHARSWTASRPRVAGTP